MVLQMQQLKYKKMLVLMTMSFIAVLYHDLFYFISTLRVLVKLCGMCASVTIDLFCDLRHSLLQVVILLRQSSVLLE